MSDAYPESPLGSPPASGLPEAWSDAVAPGGMVCAVPDDDCLDGICGNPVESEPCDRHGPTPGQAAHREWFARFHSTYAPDVARRHAPGSYKYLSDDRQREWEAVAQAAIDATKIAADRDRLAAELAACRQNNAAIAVQLDTYRDERDDARKAFAALAGHFTQTRQSGWSARVSGTVLRRLCVMAMCEPPDGTGLEALAEASDLITERDAHKLRADHYEGLWRAEHGLPPEGGVMDTAP